jgi:hypothetical protein
MAQIVSGRKSNRTEFSVLADVPPNGYGDGMGCDGCMEICAEMFKTTIMLMPARDNTVHIFFIFHKFQFGFCFVAATKALEFLVISGRSRRRVP